MKTKKIDLSNMSSLIVLIVLCMYLGRLGSLTFAMALGEHMAKAEVRMPEERIVVG